MSDYVMCNIGLTIQRQKKLFTEEDPGKPIEEFPEYYFGKLVGNAGRKLPLRRQRKGSGEEDVVNCVLRNTGDIALIRIHNKELVDIVAEDGTSDRDVPGYKTDLMDSYPFSYVVIDYREGKCQIAIEKSPVWDSRTDTIKKMLLNYFVERMSNNYGVDLTIKEKSEATKFDDFIEKRTVDESDVIESFTFEYPNMKRCRTARIPKSMTENIQRMSDILDMYNAISGRLSMTMGNNVDKDKLKQLATVVSMCSDNGFELSVKFRDFGSYKCDESIIAQFPMKEIVIDNYKDYVTADLKNSDFDLECWLDEVFDKARGKNAEEIPAKPKR